MTRFGWAVVLGLALGVLALTLALSGALPWPATLEPPQDITLPTKDGAADLLWHCQPGATPAETRARAAHDAFEAGLDDISARTAEAMAAAMAKANASGDAPEELATIDDAAQAEAQTLAARLEVEFACQLDGF